jgi:NADPH-dependent glutamate synthase beta subunit-like oxidoreductase
VSALSGSGSQVQTTRGDTFVVNDALSTSRPGVFAAGDAVNGPATIVQAVADGNLAAAAVDHWLRTGELVKPHFDTPRHDVALKHRLEDYGDKRRPATPRLNVGDRQDNFQEVETILSEAAAREEARRCLRCDLEWLDVMGIARP